MKLYREESNNQLIHFMSIEEMLQIKKSKPLRSYFDKYMYNFELEQNYVLRNSAGIHTSSGKNICQTSNMIASSKTAAG